MPTSAPRGTRFTLSLVNTLSAVDNELVVELSAAQRVAEEQLVMPVLRYPAEEAFATAVALQSGGLRAVELTMTTPDVFEVARALVDRGMTVGIGTITDLGAVALAKAAGASFAVSFCHPPGLVAAATAAGLLPIPGAFTPSECFAVHAAGGSWIKLFSCRVGGPQYLRDLIPVLPGMRFLVSGGVGITREALEPWVVAGARLIAVGRELGTVGSVGADEVSRRAATVVEVSAGLRPTQPA